MKPSDLPVPTVSQQVLFEICNADDVGRSLGKPFADALAVFVSNKEPMVKFFTGLGPKMTEFGKAGHAALLESMSQNALQLLAERGSNTVEHSAVPVIKSRLMPSLIEAAKDSGFFESVHVSALSDAVSGFGALILSNKVEKKFKAEVDSVTARALVLCASSHDERALVDATRFAPVAVSHRFFGTTGRAEYGPTTTPEALGKIWTGITHSENAQPMVMAGLLNDSNLQRAVQLGLVYPLADDHHQAPALQKEIHHVKGSNKTFLLEEFQPGLGEAQQTPEQLRSMQAAQFVGSMTKSKTSTSQP